MIEKLKNKYQNIYKMLYLDDAIIDDLLPSDRWRDFAFELEKYLLFPGDEKQKECPIEIQNSILEDSKAGYPAGMCYHPIFGYFHIYSCGQGPGIGLYEKFNHGEFSERISSLSDEEKKQYLNE